MQIGKRDIEKMIDYRSKGSSPEVLARTVKDLNKAKSRAVIASAMGWKGCSREFIKRCKELGASDADIAEVQDMCDTYELPSQYRSQVDNGPSLEDVSRLREWFPKLFKVLRDHKVQNIKLVSRRPDKGELEKDSKDGRCWTLTYTVSFDYNGKHYDWNIANHSNEGGGSFGVSAQAPLFVYQSTQQELADKAARVLDNDTVSESKITMNSTDYVVNRILEGVEIKQAVNEGIIKDLVNKAKNSKVYKRLSSLLKKSGSKVDLDVDLSKALSAEEIEELFKEIEAENEADRIAYSKLSDEEKEELEADWEAFMKELGLDSDYLEEV